MLRERTLKHLLLVVARSLEEVEENSQYRNLLRDSCESLEITRKNRGPYQIFISNENEQKVATVETSEFRFHERGDIQAQVQKRIGLPDARTHNWERATQLWHELLGVNLKKSQGLAPEKVNLPVVNRKEVVVAGVTAILLLFFEYSNLPIWPSCLFLGWTIPLIKPSKSLILIALSVMLITWSFYGQGNVVLFLPLILTFYHIEHLRKTRFDVLWPLVASVGITAVFPNQLPAMVIIINFEIVVSLVQKNYVRFSAQLICLSLAVTYLFHSNPNRQDLNVSGLTTVPLALILVIVVFPYSSESNLIRISAPLALSIATIFRGNNTMSAMRILLVWLIQVIRTARVTNPVGVTAETSGTPVTLRRSNLSS